MNRKKCESEKWLKVVSSVSAESLGSVFRKLFGYMEYISIERELVAQMVSPLHFCYWYSAVY
jgi:hypothetical protein